MVWVDKGALAVLSDAAVAAMVEGATATRGRVDERATAAANSAVAVSEAGEPARIASQLSSPTPARSAVDARIGSVVNSVVGDALASTPGVVDSVIDSINDNPTVLGALAHYKGQLLGGSIEDLVTGEYWVANQTAANALGLPDPWGGPLDVVRNGTSGSVVWRPTIDGAPRVWRKRRTSTGWGQWWADQPKPIRLTDANTTTLDALPDGTYYQDLLVVQEKLGLPARTGWILKQTHPTVGYGYCSMVEWTNTGRTHKWEAQRRNDGWQPWQDLGTGGTIPDAVSHLWMEDTAAADKNVLQIEHYGDGSGRANGQTYGIDLHNYANARQALVIHQYSGNREAVRIDNTDQDASIYINNTQNLNYNPTGTGEGAPFLKLHPYNMDDFTYFAYLMDDLTFRNDVRGRAWSFRNLVNTKPILEFKSSTNAVVAAIDQDGSIITTSPNGTKWRIVVGDDGSLSTQAV